MAIKRKSYETFDMGRLSVAEHVRKVLIQNPPYQLLKEVKTEKVFEVTFKPYWWGGSSYMKVSLEDEGFSTRVIVEITSPWYTLGDVFTFYNKLINDFMLDLRNHMENTNPINRFVYRYNQDTMRFLLLLGLSIGIVGILILLIGLIQSINLKTFLPGVTILFVTSALFLGYVMYGSWKHKRINR